MATYTLTYILEQAMNYFRDGLAEAASPRDNTSDAEIAYHGGTALMTVDSFAWNTVQHDWPNSELDPGDCLTDAERDLMKAADTLQKQLRAELERLWEKDQKEYSEWFDRELAKQK